MVFRSVMRGVAALVAVMAVSLPGTASAAADDPVTAVSYINRETGTVFENPNVTPGSECESPDRVDRQPLSDPATGNPGNNNVHNDACLFDATGALVDEPVTWESFGAGYISACPDPDLTATGNGPKTAILDDRNGDGRMDRCRQTGSQSKGAAGDDEYHVRLNNNTAPGKQAVRFCYDPDQDGCADETVIDGIRINWVAPRG